MSARLEVERWIRSEWLFQKFRRKFHKKNLLLKPGGRFEFDAVSADGEIIAVISTSAAKTNAGNAGSAKRQKIYHDIYFLLQAKGCFRRIAIFSEECMYKHFIGERDQRKKVPVGIEFFYADNIPSDLRAALEAARKKSKQQSESAAQIARRDNGRRALRRSQVKLGSGIRRIFASPASIGQVA